MNNGWVIEIKGIWYLTNCALFEEAEYLKSDKSRDEELFYYVDEDNLILIDEEQIAYIDAFLVRNNII